MSTILIVSAHPDDETLGMGGTILRHVAAGDVVHWLVMSAGWEPRYPAAVLTAKRAEVDAVAAHYRLAGHAVAGLPCTRLADLPLNELIAPLSDTLARLHPETVYSVHPGDVHTDHGAVFAALWSACRAFRAGGDGPRRILSWETLSSTDPAPPDPARAFTPNLWLGIDAQLDGKLAAMALYASEAQADPLPRGPGAIRALARLRGAQVGLLHAEAFHLHREVQP